ncbi:interleukin-15 receptor subunit alpha isoform X8 [Acanthopagrus latus]|uniref:interleukin-15 receptor subunit alpha isoform X8 n=1 Tax=Acanthopagrus latus TaxID=8177 RepID=UPI00187BDF20|nr:interleukin-15 receptor subunit alpha isoform X8 [Acanthopagrus latus]
MDLGFLVFSFFAMMISPPGDVRCSAGDAISCPCSAIPPLNLTQPPPETCLEVDSRFRYNCAKGYVRKAGTSNLIKCQNTTGVVKWTEATLQCIPDPKIVPTPPPSPPVKQGLTDILPISTIATTVTEKAATETRTVAWMTQGSTIAALSQRSTAEPQRHELSSTIARNSIVPLVIICACAGICFYYYKRRTRNMIPVRTSEEDVPMDGIQPQDSVRSQPATAVEGIRLNGDQDCGA